MHKTSKRIYIPILLIVFSFRGLAQHYQPVIAVEKLVQDTFYKEYIVKDSYQWLENTSSAESINWIENENKAADKYLASAANKTGSLASLKKYSFTEFEIPNKFGKYFFSYYGRGTKTRALYYCRTFNGVPKMLVNPDLLSNTDVIDLYDYHVSKDSKWLVYLFGRNGSDWREARVVSLEDGKELKDSLVDLRFSSISWLKDGFYYSTYSRDEQFALARGQRVFYHRIGTPQRQDSLVFQRKVSDRNRFSYKTTSDERFFILSEINEKSDTRNIFYVDTWAEKLYMRPLFMNLIKDQNIDVIDNIGDKFIALSNYKSNTGSIVEVDPNDPYKWKELIHGFSRALLMHAQLYKDRIVTLFQSDQHPVFTLYDYAGNALKSLELPIATSVLNISGDWDDDALYYCYTSYTIPPVAHKLRINDFKDELLQATVVNFYSRDIEYKELTYYSKDSTPVNMTIVYEKGLKLNGTNPTILSAYGGFGLVEQASFDPGIVNLVKSGGVFAFANIRGGGDKGISWAMEGKENKKQNAIDDFIAAAEYLISNKYTSPKKLAIKGASHGGLVVAAAAIQRPGLFKTVVASVAPLDMIRKEKFTTGILNIKEYGTVTDSLNFVNLLKYSPYHNVLESQNYPSMLLITSENDDRVPPFHSYKFAAKMQNRSEQKNPIIIKIAKRSGHYGASTNSSRIQELVDTYGFIMNELQKE